jgi:hypothetical protein
LLAICRTGNVEKAAGFLTDHIMGACQSLLHHLPGRRT